MRVLFTPIAAPSHLYPHIPLAWALRAAGCEVRVAATPELTGTVANAGLAAVPVGGQRAGLEKVFRISQTIYRHRPYPPDWPLNPHLLDADQRESIELFGLNWVTFAESVVDELIAFARWWRPDLVVHDVAGIAGAVAAAAIGVPNVRGLNGPSVRPMELGVDGREPLPGFVDLFERRGLTPRTVPAMTIDPSPPGVRLPVADPYREVRYVPYNGTGVIPDWVDKPADRPRVCVTWGIAASRASRRFGSVVLDPCRWALAALSTVDAEVVLAAGTADQLELLGDLPANVRPLVAMPLHVLLPHCSLVVHQGGEGTGLTAAVHGVPQLIIYGKHDQDLLSHRLATAGVAMRLRAQDLATQTDPPATVRVAVESLLADSSCAAAAARLAERIRRQPAPADLVPALKSLTGQGV
jgi:UDP:flavonoid glycosyltransferase YjiC (YdhE family)